MIPSWLLPLGERCPEARELYNLHPELVTGGFDQIWRDAFQTGVLAMTGEPPKVASYLMAHRGLLATLPSKLSVAATEAIASHMEEVRKGNVATVHRFAYGLDMDMDGLSPSKREPSVGLRPDCLWNETTGAGEQTAIVLQHETSFLAAGDAAWPDLGILAMGLAWGVINDVERVRVGRCIHTIGRPVRYQWTDAMGDREMQHILARVRKSLTSAREARVGKHCYDCSAVRACGAWQLPALTDVHQALKPLQTSGEGVSKANVEQVRRVALAMKHVSDVALIQIREFDRVNGTPANDNALTTGMKEMAEAVRRWA